jgi:uncharacterized protein YgiM (DUF1202 family)
MKRLYQLVLLPFLLAALMTAGSATWSVAAAAPAVTGTPALSLAYTSATAVVATGALNVRSGPGINFSRVAVIYQGHVVTLLGRNSGASWAQIRTGAGQTGWVNVSFIQAGVAISTLPVTDTQTPAPAAAATAIVATGALNVRSGPGIGYSIVTVVRQGESVGLLGRNAPASWAQVRPASGHTGWVNVSLIQPTVAIGTLPLVEAPAATAAPLATVATGALNVRTGPGAGYSVITTLQNGRQAPLLGRNTDNTWVQIRLATGQVGWVHTAFIQTPVPISSLPLGSTTATAPAATATIATWALNVRTGPGVSYGILTAVQQGQQVTLLGRNAAATWVQVRLASGHTGWLNAFFIQPSVGIGTLPVTG